MKSKLYTKYKQEEIIILVPWREKKKGGNQTP